MNRKTFCLGILISFFNLHAMDNENPSALLDLSNLSKSAPALTIIREKPINRSNSAPRLAIDPEARGNLSFFEGLQPQRENMLLRSLRKLNRCFRSDACRCLYCGTECASFFGGLSLLVYWYS